MHCFVHRRAKSGISGLIALLIRSILQRFGGQRFQRRSAEPRHVAGRSSSPPIPSIEEIGNVWGDSGLSPSPPARRRAMKNVRYNVEMEYSRPLGWISRASDGKFVIKGQPMFGKSSYFEDHSHNYDLTPSNQASVRGSFRSDGSGQSGPTHTHQIQFPPHRHHSHITRSSTHSSLPSRTYRNQSFSPQSYSFRSGQISSIYRPRDSRFRTSSPGPGLAPDSLSMDQELSSVRQTSSFERSSGQIPTISSAALRSHLHELPALRPIHEHLHRHHHNHNVSPLRATVPIARQPNFRPINRGPLLLETVPEAIYDSGHLSPMYRLPTARMGIESGVWGDGRHIHIAPQLHQYPNTHLLRGDSTLIFKLKLCFN